MNYISSVLKPELILSLIVYLGYRLMEKSKLESIQGFIKTIIGYNAFKIGSKGIVGVFEPFITSLVIKFEIDALVIDPIMTQHIIEDNIFYEFGVGAQNIIMVLLMALLINIILVKFKDITKFRSVFTSGNIQIQQAGLCYWIFLILFPEFSPVHTMLLSGLFLGVYWSFGSNLTVESTQELTNGSGFAIAHHQMFGIYLTSKIATLMSRETPHKKKRKETAVSIILKDSIFTNFLAMTFLFSILFFVVGKDYFIQADYLMNKSSSFSIIMSQSIMFTTYFMILQFGISTFVRELNTSFKGISHKLLPGSLPAIDVAAIYQFGSSYGATIGMIFGIFGQVIGMLILYKTTPTLLVISTFIPLFFDNATLGIYAFDLGGQVPAMIIPLFSGFFQIIGTSLVIRGLNLIPYGSYIGMFDWVTVWPFIVYILRNTKLFGLFFIIVIMLVIPNIQYLRNDKYFTVVDEYESNTV